MSTNKPYIYQTIGIFTLFLFILGCQQIITPTSESESPEINIKQTSTNILCGTGTYDFGNIGTGVSSDQIIFTIQNAGNQTLNLTDNPLITISDVNADQFNINQSSLSATIAAGSTSTFGITFNPTSDGNKTATISIPNNDSNKNPYTFFVSGTGMSAPEINIKQGSTNILCSTGIYNFGNIDIGSSSNMIFFSLQNIGNQILNLTDNPLIKISGTNADQFSIDQSSLTTTIAAWSSGTFGLTFLPSSAGSKTAAIWILNNDSDENPYTFTISGTGILESEINIKQGSDTIISGIGTYNFGSIAKDASSSEIFFTIENIRNQILYLSGSPLVAIGGTNSDQFSVNQSSLSSAIDAGSTSSFGITFHPTGYGTKTATITIYNNDSDENPYTFSITGIGLIPPIFSDNFENGLDNWIIGGDDWDRTTEQHRSGSYCITDSPYGYYANNVNCSITLKNSINLVTSTKPILTFWHKLDIRFYGDYCYVEISTDGGFEWTDLITRYSNTVSTWTFVQIDLAGYRATPVKIRFRLDSYSTGTTNDGWYIDDVEIKEL